MGIVSVHRGSRGVGYLSGGTQYVDGALSLPASPWTIYLSNAVYPIAGKYVLFDYSGPGGSFNGLNLNQISFNTDDLVQTGTPSVADSPSEKKVILTLKSNPNNGTQYVEGTLDISAGTVNIQLSPDIYRSAGDYILFSFPNGYSVTGSLSNLNVTPPAGLTLSAAPSQVGNTIQITLA